MWKRESALAVPTGKPDRPGSRTSRFCDYASDEDVPTSGALRWVIRRKAAVVRAVRSGELSEEEACCRYMLSREELLGWQRTLERHGVAGLRTTRINQYRRAFNSRRERLIDCNPQLECLSRS
jgi:hypothetical protein